MCKAGAACLRGCAALRETRRRCAQTRDRCLCGNDPNALYWHQPSSRVELIGSVMLIIQSVIVTVTLVRNCNTGSYVTSLHLSRRFFGFSCLCYVFGRRAGIPSRASWRHAAGGAMEWRRDAVRQRLAVWTAGCVSSLRKFQPESTTSSFAHVADQTAGDDTHVNIVTLACRIHHSVMRTRQGTALVKLSQRAAQATLHLSRTRLSASLSRSG